jgi:hypothetical protein
VRSVGLSKRLEHARRKSGAMPAPVSDTVNSTISADAARRDRHRAAPRRELQGVGEKVRRDLTDPIGVDEREEFVIAQVPVQRDLLGLGQGHHALDDHSRDGGQVNGLSLQGHLAGEECATGRGGR